ncbi:RCC1 domain-containing protein [Legionella fairfieldensis]|uniref:RCC1 domain-containing protein n=1 Tax=Legionella fairfieldensis TaxID=45064 RepID=UPI00049142E2|nr:hypothetical protein [Legionella fairfieldensis]
MTKIIYKKEAVDNSNATFVLDKNNDFPSVANIKKQDNARWDLHSMALTGDGSVYVLGCNYEGQLGLGDTNDRKKPTKIEGLPPIKDFTLGHMSSFLIDENNNVYSFGENRYGQLGLGHKNNVSIPQEVTALKGCNITRIHYWHAAAFFLSTEGKVYYSGSFDHSAMFSPIKPRVFYGLPPITKIHSTTDFTAFLADTGEVYVQPDNNCIHTCHKPAKLQKLPFKEIIDIGVYNITTNSGCGLSVQMLLDNCGKVFVGGFLDEPLDLPEVKRMTQCIPLEQNKYLDNVFELCDGSFAIVEIKQKSNLDFEIVDTRVTPTSKLAEQLTKALDKRAVEKAPLELEKDTFDLCTYM